MAQFCGDAPVLPHPGQRLRVARPARQQGVRHREQRVQVERAGRALPVPQRGLGLVRLERGAKASPLNAPRAITHLIALGGRSDGLLGFEGVKNLGQPACLSRTDQPV